MSKNELIAQLEKLQSDVDYKAQVQGGCTLAPVIVRLTGIVRQLAEERLSRVTLATHQPSSAPSR